MSSKRPGGYALSQQQYLLPQPTNVQQPQGTARYGAPKTAQSNDYTRYYMQVQQNFPASAQAPHHEHQLQGQQHAQLQVTSVSNTAVSSTTPSENDDEGIGSSLADLDSLTDLLPMMAPDLVTCIKTESGIKGPQPTNNSSPYTSLESATSSPC